MQVRDLNARDLNVRDSESRKVWLTLQARRSHVSAGLFEGIMDSGDERVSTRPVVDKVRPIVVLGSFRTIHAKNGSVAYSETHCERLSRTLVSQDAW